MYIKVELEHEPDEDPAKTAEEICRQIRKFYNVRFAEVTGISGDQN